MLTDYILGLSSSLRFVGCGGQIHFGPLWISNPLVEFSSVHVGSWLLLCLGLCKFPSHYLEELCVLWVVDFHNCWLSFPCFGTVDCCYHSLCVWVAEVPWFTLLLSCFGHARAKNNSELPSGLELCFTCWLGLSPVGCLCLLHRAVKGLFCCVYAVVGLQTVLAWSFY